MGMGCRRRAVAVALGVLRCARCALYRIESREVCVPTTIEVRFVGGLWVAPKARLSFRAALE